VDPGARDEEELFGCFCQFCSRGVFAPAGEISRKKTKNKNTTKSLILAQDER
jgi:hypothetical protein